MLVRKSRRRKVEPIIDPDEDWDEEDACAKE